MSQLLKTLNEQRGAKLAEAQTIREKVETEKRGLTDDERTGWVVVIAALDNIAKGASGGAIQSLNVVFGLPETSGLSSVGVYP